MASYVGKTPARQAIVADNTITSAKIVDSTISTSDILDSTITGSDLASNIVINTTGSITSGALTACGLSYPTADGTSGQVIQTDGAGNLTFATASGGGGDVVDDTTPQLGGNLDLNSFDITGTNICIDSSGCLGIGNQAAPTSSYNIDIAASGTHGNIRLQRANVSNQYLLIGVSDGSRHDIQGYGDKTIRIMSRATTQEIGIEFWTNSTCKMKIDGLGNIYLGSTQSSPSNVVGSTNTCTGMVFECGGYIGVSTNSECALILNRRTSDGDIAQFRKDGITVGTIGAISGLLSVGSGDTGIKFWSAGDAIAPSNPDSSNANRDASIDIGTSSNRFKDLYLSGGAYIGGTGTANKLDDYEEGTWTPTYVASTTDFTSVTYQQQNGKYTKIGDTVSLTVTLSTNAITQGSASGDVYIAGLPFTPNSNYSNGTILYTTANWLGDMPDGWTTFGTTRGYLYYKSSTTAVSSINPADMGTGGSANNFIATMIYKTDA